MSFKKQSLIVLVILLLIGVFYFFRMEKVKIVETSNDVIKLLEENKFDKVKFSTYLKQDDIEMELAFDKNVKKYPNLILLVSKFKLNDKNGRELISQVKIDLDEKYRELSENESSEYKNLEDKKAVKLNYKLPTKLLADLTAKFLENKDYILDIREDFKLN